MLLLSFTEGVILSLPCFVMLCGDFFAVFAVLGCCLLSVFLIKNFATLDSPGLEWLFLIMTYVVF